MTRAICMEDLKDLMIEENIDLPETEDRSAYRNYSKNIALTVGFLLGVSDESLMKRLENSEEYLPIKEALEKNEDAVAIRHLNNIRSNLILHFKEVSLNLRNMNATFTPLDRMDLFKDDFKVLNRMSIYIQKLTLKVILNVIQVGKCMTMRLQLTKWLSSKQHGKQKELKY